MADKVMHMPEPQVSLQPKDEEKLRRQPVEEEDETLRQQSLEENEELNRQPIEEEDEKLRQQPVEEDEELNRQPIDEEEETLRQQPIEEEDETMHQQPEEEEKETLTAKESPGRTPTVTPKIQADINAMRGGGKPLSDHERSFFEPRFGRDFSQVRLHTDKQATETARAVRAKAFTTGRDVVFGENQYAPETSAGKKLLAHELTHTIQQKTTTKNHLSDNQHLSTIMRTPIPGEKE